MVGTNARFAIAEASGIGFHSVETFPCEGFGTPEAAIESFLKAKGLPDPDAICLAAAGPVRQGAAEFTNNPWKLCETNLKAHFGAPLVRVSNDFEAIAHALPHLRAQDVQVLGTEALLSPGNEPFCYAVVGPGTGLGAAALLGHAGAAQVAVSEAGHMGFAPESPLQDSILGALRQRFGRVSA
ncbi:MAG: glucokinase, partial [Pseudomonadales bacterium]